MTLLVSLRCDPVGFRETRDFTYVLDLVQCLIKAGYYEKAVGENFNLASGTEGKGRRTIRRLRRLHGLGKKGLKDGLKIEDEKVRR